jgi:hypothetical protein
VAMFACGQHHSRMLFALNVGWGFFWSTWAQNAQNPLSSADMSSCLTPPKIVLNRSMMFGCKPPFNGQTLVVQSTFFFFVGVIKQKLFGWNMDNKLNEKFPDDLGNPHIKKGFSTY